MGKGADPLIADERPVTRHRMHIYGCINQEFARCGVSSQAIAATAVRTACYGTFGLPDTRGKSPGLRAEGNGRLGHNQHRDKMMRLGTSYSSGSRRLYINSRRSETTQIAICTADSPTGPLVAASSAHIVDIS